MTPGERRAAFADMAGAVARILELQRADGAIPWTEAGVVDPWNHAEGAMALAVAGEVEAARRAFDFLKDSQNADGSWWGDYGNAAPLDEDAARLAAPKDPPLKDTNYAAYPSLALWRIHRLGDGEDWLAAYGPMTLKAMDFVLAQQSGEGEIRFAAQEGAQTRDDALVAGNASIHKSLEAAAALAAGLGEAERAARYVEARARLGAALREKPHRFDRTWGSKARYSMDWYYPVLSGALDHETAGARLDARWTEFVEPGLGCRCVADQPWVTAAETCELALACLKLGRRDAARALLAAADRLRDEAGAYWMGRQFEEGVFWPADKPSWTAAAAILARDAFDALTPGSGTLIADIAVNPAG